MSIVMELLSRMPADRAPQLAFKLLHLHRNKLREHGLSWRVTTFVPRNSRLYECRDNTTGRIFGFADLFSVNINNLLHDLTGGVPTEIPAMDLADAFLYAKDIGHVVGLTPPWLSPLQPPATEKVKTYVQSVSTSPYTPDNSIGSEYFGGYTPKYSIGVQAYYATDSSSVSWDSWEAST